MKQMNILIIGATSAIVEHTARRYAKSGHNLFLVARNEKKLEAITSDLRIRGASKVESALLDVNEIKNHNAVIESAFTIYKSIDIVLIGHGTLPNQSECEKSVTKTLEEISTNSLSTISLLTILANKFEEQKSGCICAITSVAGDRGRQSNYVYGAAKSLVSTFLQGLANRLHKSGVRVIDIKPGFVDTPMTRSFEKGGLWITPDKAATVIERQTYNGRNTIYTPWFWFFIMGLIKLIPSVIFNRLKL